MQGLDSDEVCSHLHLHLNSLLRERLRWTIREVLVDIDRVVFFVDPDVLLVLELLKFYIDSLLTICFQLELDNSVASLPGMVV